MDFSAGKDEKKEPVFVGRTGRFVPVDKTAGGGTLLREKDGVFHSAAGAKGYLWKEADVVDVLDIKDQVDMSYFDKLLNDAISKIEQFVPINTLLGESDG